MSDRTRAEAQEADADGPGRPGGDEHAPPTSKWEWAVAALGAALVAGAIGYLVYHALTIGEGVPEVVVEHAGTRAVQGGHIVRFLARNRGSTTAASLRIEGALLRDSSVVETSEATLDYLPSFSERQGGLFFREDPGRYELRLVPKGYADP